MDYEIAVLYDPGLEVDIDTAENSFKKIIGDAKGKIVSSDSWGKRRLAYEIKKHDSAIYIFYKVNLNPDKIAEVNASLNITTKIIRFLVTKIDYKRLAKAEAEREFKKKRQSQRNSDDSNED